MASRESVEPFQTWRIRNNVVYRANNGDRVQSAIDHARGHFKTIAHSLPERKTAVFPELADVAERVLK